MACQCLKCKLVGVINEEFRGELGPEEIGSALRAVAVLSGVLLAPTKGVAIEAFVMRVRLEYERNRGQMSESGKLSRPVH